jgi:RimJ/RimL family protein N-acetyltransferase
MNAAAQHGSGHGPGHKPGDLPPAFPPPVETRRLILRPVGSTLARALIGDRRQAGELAQGLLHRDFPDAALTAMLPAFAQRLDDAANLALRGTAPVDPGGWGLWLLVYKPERMVVGAFTFGGPPSPSGEVQIGYQVVPAHRRRGLTVEAARALIGWAFNDSRVARVRADCAADNVASMRTLEKLGFERLGGERANGGGRNGHLHWQVTRTAWLSPLA